MVIILINKLFLCFFFVAFERMLNFIKTSFATVCKIILAFRTYPVITRQQVNLKSSLNL